jgi:hypothetical protein
MLQISGNLLRILDVICATVVAEFSSASRDTAVTSPCTNNKCQQLEALAQPDERNTEFLIGYELRCIIARRLYPLIMIFILSLAPLASHAQENALPPDIRFDILRLEMEAAARDRQHKEVLAIADKIRKLGVDYPTEMLFLEARAFHALGSSAMARHALLNYLNTNARKGKHYDDAIRLFVEIKRVQRAKDKNAKAQAAMERELERARAAMRRARQKKEAWKKLAVVFGGPGDDSALALAHRSDGGLVLAGALHARKASEGKTVNTTLPWITAFDAKGRRSWHRPLGSAENAGELRSIVSISGKGFLIGGVQKGFQFVAISDPLGNLINNEDGDPWVIGFAPANGEDAGSIARLLPSGDIVAIGAADIGSSQDTGGALARLPVMVRLSPTGKVRAKAVLGETKVPNWHTLRNAIVVDGSDLIIAGEARRNGEKTAGAYLMRIDAEGKNIWTRPIPPSGSGTLVVNTLAILPGGGVLAAGRDGNKQMVVAVTGSGDVLWRKTIASSSQDTQSYPQLCRKDAKVYEQDIATLRTFACTTLTHSESAAEAIATAGDLFLIIGHERSAGNANGRIALTAIKANGGIAWQSTQGEGTDTRPHAAIATADGGFIIAGTTAGWGRDVTLLKVDSKGELVRFAALTPRQVAPLVRPGHKPHEPPVARRNRNKPKEPAAVTTVPEPAKEAKAKPTPRNVTPPQLEKPATDADVNKPSSETEDGSDYSFSELFNGLFKTTPEVEPKPIR